MKRTFVILLSSYAALAHAVFAQYATPVRISWMEDSATTATLTWDTDYPARGIVRYGTSTNYTHEVRDGGGTHLHAITLRNLEPGTRYFYEASTTNGFLQSGTFRTAPRTGESLHFIIHGDLEGGLNNDAARGVSERILMENPQWVVHIGDMGDEANYSDARPGFLGWEYFFDIASNELASVVFMPQMGNHDNPEDRTSGRPPGPYGLMTRLFSLPYADPGHVYYSYTVGNTRFIVLNSEDDMPSQNEWLTLELQDAANNVDIQWILCMSHRPLYSWGERERDDVAYSNWMPRVTQYEANWMFSGHSHTYQRTVPIRDVNYLVTGGGGGRIYGYKQNSSLLFSTGCYHHTSIHITNDVMQLRGIRSDGYVFDSTITTNRRQVRVSPPFPERGKPARVYFKPTISTLANSNSISIHIGQDAFTNAFASEAMTWSAADQAWVYDFTVPATATQRVAFAFYSGGKWDNHYEFDNSPINWQALLARATVTPEQPQAGGTASIRYEGDMGPIAGKIGTSTVYAWPEFRCLSGEVLPASERIALTKTTGSRWEGAISIPEDAVELILVFSAGSQMDDNHKHKWTFQVAGATHEKWPRIPPYVAKGSPVVTPKPESGKNNPGDNFDFVMDSPPLLAKDAVYGFGDWGKIWFNADATHLYVGGIDLDMGGTNNVFMLFLGLDTLTDDAWNLWHKSGLPNAADALNNLRFTEPMDIVLILGDQYGDRPNDASFVFGGYDFGQGIYYIGTNSAAFVPIEDARLSQFDGTGTTPCLTRNDSGNDNRTTRWEAAIPWSALGATRPEDAAHLFVGGVIASSAKNDTRYLSRTYVGDGAWGRKDEYNRFARYPMTLKPTRIHFLHGDWTGDGLSNEWRMQFFNSIGGPAADEDSDNDGYTNRQEEMAWTDPLNPASYFATALGEQASNTFALSWPFSENRLYDVYFTTNLLTRFTRIVESLHTNSYIPDNTDAEAAFYQIRVRK